MSRILALLSLLGLVAAFNAPAPLRAPKLRSARIAMEEAAAEAVEEEEAEPAPPPPPAVEYSASLPFLVKRPQLAGYIGDVGFDPLGFSEIFPMDWLREAELKHARVCMLAVVGFVATDFFTLPGDIYKVTTLEAHDAGVASGAMGNMLIWLGLFEIVSLIAINQMLQGSGREPGDYGFDPMGFAKDPKKKADLQMKELANGRLAMFAFSGMVTQAVLTGNTFPYLFDN